MTNVPDCLLAPRRLLRDHLDIPSDALGIVGDSAHRGGYHCGSDRLDAGRDYSVVESRRDRNGLTLDACALDVGEFSHGAHNLRTFSRWVVAQCAAGTPDSRDIREVIYSPDGKIVKRWDRLGKRSSGDGSHLVHTHLSIFRDAVKAGRDPLSSLFRRYLTTIGLLEDDMPLTRTEIDAIAQRVWTWDLLNGDGEDPAYRVLNRAAAAAVAAAGADPVDEAAVATELLKVLTPQSIAAAIPAALTQQVADELARRLADAPSA